MKNRTNIIAACLLIFVFLTTFSSMKGDSLTMDEKAHLPAGYSYLTQKDMRINPEHPPLIKDVAALPLLFIKGIKFPSEIKAWADDVNGQWDFGSYFLFETGNPADEMIFWGRIPMILILILLGFYIFKWARELFGDRAALLALFLFSFSPTFLAHGRLVTTDVGAATGAFIAFYYFVRFLRTPSNKNLIFAGISLGIAELIKFSLFLLFPIFLFLILVWAIAKASDAKSFLKNFGNYLLKFVFITIIAFLIIGPVYQYHVWNYPPARQARDIDYLLSSHPIQFLRKTLVWASKIPILRAYAQYFLGVALVFQRAIGGNTTFFLGEVSASGWPIYFPLVYLLKEPLTLHILTAFSLIYVSLLITEPIWKNIYQRLISWLKQHFAEFSMLVFIITYWVSSISSPLNIGVRHLLPVFPFTFVLVSGVISLWLKPPHLRLKYLILGILILWQVVSVLKIYPHFLAYFNEIAGGPDKGYLYTVDSNLDWGQDLKRLKKWVDENKIDKIYVDYFGGGDAKYYLKEKFSPWWGTRDPKEMPKGSYLAVSATLLQGGRGEAVSGFDQPTGYYDWLDLYEPPIAKIGYSIFIYRID